VSYCQVHVITTGEEDANTNKEFLELKALLSTTFS